jgi:hypothetical protein
LERQGVKYKVRLQGQKLVSCQESTCEGKKNKPRRG